MAGLYARPATKSDSLAGDWRMESSHHKGGDSSTAYWEGKHMSDDKTQLELQTKLQRFRERLASVGGDLTKAVDSDPLKGAGTPEAIGLISALRDYIANRGPGSQSDDAIDRATIAAWQRIIAALASAGELTSSWGPFDPKAFAPSEFDGYNRSGFRKHKALPLGVVAKNDDHREALLAMADVGRELLDHAYARGNSSAPLPKSTTQNLTDVEASAVRKASPRRATSLSDITGS